jgi:antitoxin (DNA-binding transcriptional repressor) of toxin-antitoxin stability system
LVEDGVSTRVSAVEARKNLGKLLNIVSLRGEELIIERAGKPIARLGPVGDCASEGRSGKLTLREGRGLGKEHWRTRDVDAYIRDERSSWE